VTRSVIDRITDALGGRADSNRTRPTDRGDRPTAAIEVADLTAGYGDLTVLNGVSLSVAPGELVGLVGPNGAGKTTLLRTINGVATPDSGAVRVGEAPIDDLDARAASRLVATVPQDTTVAFDFTVEDIVAMGRTPYHGRFSRDPDAAAAVERALDRTETARFRDRSVGSLSGGQRQRVLLARALAQDTPALLLDEPTASLDINHQVRTLELVVDLVETEGKAAIAAIHDLDLAARFCDRLALLADGECLAVGTPDEVLAADQLRAAFGTDAAVVPDPVTGTPSVTPLATPEASARTGVCHVLGTGTEAARAIAALARAGFDVTVGAVPTDDIAAVTARERAVETVTVPPYETPDDDALVATRDLVARADAVVCVGALPDALAACCRTAGPVVRLVDGSVTVGSGEDAPADWKPDASDGHPESGRRQDGRAHASGPTATAGADGETDRSGAAADPVERSAVPALLEAVETAVTPPSGGDD